MTDLVLDPGASHLRIRTYAEGMLSALAHDLELDATTLEAEAAVEGDSFTVRLAAPVSAIRVRGVLKRGEVDTQSLKASDKADIEQKLRREVLDAPSVEVSGEGKMPEGARQRRSLEVRLGPRKTSISTEVVVEASSERYLVKGRAELRLSALGIKPVKGPLGAFRLKDAVEIVYELTLRQR